MTSSDEDWASWWCVHFLRLYNLSWVCVLNVGTGEDPVVATIDAVSAYFFASALLPGLVAPFPVPLLVVFVVVNRHKE